MVNRVWIAALLALGFAAPPHRAEGASKWLRLRSAHFVLVGDASDGDLRAVAERVEAFREVLTQTLPGQAALSAVPTVIVVFGSSQSFTPYKPLYQGKPAEVGGYFVGREDINYIALNVAGGSASYSIIFHELAHELVNNRLLAVPVWLNEGIAELYRTFEDRDRGRTAMIGLPPPEHLTGLRRVTFMPLAELMAVNYSSPAYHERSRMGVFYAESWALTHYLLLGNERRRAQLNQYMLDLNEGRSELEAFRHAFGVEPRALENEVREYIRRFLFPATQVKFDRSVRQAVPRAPEPISENEAQVYLGDLLSRTGRTDEARAIFERVLKAEPDSPRALAGLGLLHVRERRVDEGLPLLRRAASLMPDEPWIVASFGDALAARLAMDNAAARREGVQEARAVLQKAAAMAPDDAHLAATQGRIEMLVHERLGEARSLFERAAGLAPTREAYKFMLAQVMIEQQDYEGATNILGSLLARGSRPELKNQARVVLTRVAQLRTQSAQRAEDREQGAGAPRSQPPSLAGMSSPSSAASAAAQFIPDLRPLRDGEVRVLGQFQAVDCPSGRVVLVVGTADRVIRLVAARFDDVQLVSYRQDGPPQVKCGPVTPSWRALATYRAAPSAGSDGEAIAIELIPDDYTPPRPGGSGLSLVARP